MGADGFFLELMLFIGFLNMTTQLGNGKSSSSCLLSTILQVKH